MSESAVSARREALLAAIKGNSALAAALKGEKVYVRSAPEMSPLPYVLLTQTIELDAGYVMQPGQEGVEDMTLWDINLVRAQAIYTMLYRVLNKKKIPLTGHLQVTGSLSYLSDLPDPSREAHGVVARWRARTINA